MPNVRNRTRLVERPAIAADPRPLGIAALIVAAFSLFFRLGSLPSQFSGWETAPCRLGIGRYVFGNPFGPANWKWSSVVVDTGCQAAVQALIVEIGLRVCGASVLGIRFVPALLALLSLILVYREVARQRSIPFAAVFLALLGSAPFYLYFARSGNFAGTTLSLTIFVCCAFCRLIRAEGRLAWGWGLATGIAFAYLPFFYHSARPVPVVLMAILLAWRPFPREKVAAVAIGFLLTLPYPYARIPHELAIYFNARGESLMGRHFPGLGAVLGQVADNVFALIRQLVDGYATWNVTLASSSQYADVTLYPPYLVPFFLVGLAVTLARFRRRPGWQSGWPLLAFAVGSLAPLGVAVGNVNAMRMHLLVFPLYYFITEGLALAWDKASEPRLERWRRLRWAIPALVVLAAADQGGNALARRRSVDGSPRELVLMRMIHDLYLHDMKPRVLVLPDAPRDLSRLMIYGGDLVVDRIRDGSLTLTRIDSWNARLFDRTADIVISEKAIPALDSILGPSGELKSEGETFAIYQVHKVR